MKFRRKSKPKRGIKQPFDMVEAEIRRLKKIINNIRATDEAQKSARELLEILEGRKNHGKKMDQKSHSQTKSYSSKTRENGKTSKR